MKELDALYETIKDRKENKEEGSYTTYLFEKGLEKILKKVGEECTEVVIASLTQTKEDQINENRRSAVSSYRIDGGERNFHGGCQCGAGTPCSENA